jgi:hypothetical protein
MTRWNLMPLILAAATPMGCGDDGSSAADGALPADGAARADAAPLADVGPLADSSLGTYEEAQAAIDAYRAAHPGSDGDINAKSPGEIAADPAAQDLLALCGDAQRPVIPLLAWEYGGSDHAWINPEQSALVYCVYIPVASPTDHWRYDEGTARVTADTYVLYPEHNPCKDQVGADQVAACIGDPTNFEILVDIASLNDGADAGLALAEASTELMLILGDGAKVHLVTNL